MPDPGQQRKVSRRALFGIIGAGAVVVAGGAFGVRALVGGSDDGPNLDALPGAASNGGITQQDIDVLVGALNTALTQRDRAGFVAKHAPGAVATQAGRMFDNLGKFTFDKLEYQVIGQNSRVFASGKGSSVSIDIALVHQIRGVDATPLPEWYQWTLSRSGTGAPVVITAVAGSKAVMGEAKYVYYPAIWDSPNDIVVINRPNVVLAAETAADAAILNRNADTISHAVSSNRSTWKQAGGPTKGLAPGAFILGTSNRDKFYYWYSGEANKRGNEAAITIPVLSAASMDDNATQVCGARIVADLTTSFFTDDSGQDRPQTLFQHEDMHNLMFSIMTADETSIPLWVVEGVADFMATRVYPNPLKNFINLPEMKQYATAGAGGKKWDRKSFPTNDDVYDPNATKSNACYGLGTMVFYFIEQQYGLDKVVAFTAGNYQQPAGSDGAPGKDDPGAVVSRVLGISLDELQTKWAAFVQQVIGA